MKVFSIVLTMSMAIGAFAHIPTLLKDYPSCDPLYIQAFQKNPSDELMQNYFRRAARSPRELLYLLRYYDTLAPYLPRNLQDPITLLERFISVYIAPPPPRPCPKKIKTKKVTLLGYIDQIDKDRQCYTFSLIYQVEGEKDQKDVTFILEDPWNFYVMIEHLANLMKRGRIPLIHRKVKMTQKLELKAPPVKKEKPGP